MGIKVRPRKILVWRKIDLMGGGERAITAGMEAGCLSGEGVTEGIFREEEKGKTRREHIDR